MSRLRITCIGGGHGLGRLLKSLAIRPEYDLTAIVATTDDGGSTGLLKAGGDSIGWGDIRYCVGEVCHDTSMGQFLLKHRFDNGVAEQHALGNLILHALNDYCARPTDTVAVIQKMLSIPVRILPMTDEPCDLIANSNTGAALVGETTIANQHENTDADSISLSQTVSATPEVLTAIEQSDLVILAPGSFATSILPPLLMPEVVSRINQSSANLIMIANLVREECDPFTSLEHKLSFLFQLGLKPIQQVLQSDAFEKRQSDFTNFSSYRMTNQSLLHHEPALLLAAIETYLGRHHRQIAY